MRRNPPTKVEFRRIATFVGVLVLTGSCAPDPLNMTTSLTCRERVRCNVISWSLGIRQGPHLSGTHGGCHCIDK